MTEDTNWPQELILALQDATTVKNPVIESIVGKQIVLHPDSHRVAEFSIPDWLPNHISAHPIFDDRVSLEAYVKRFSTRESLLMADYDAGRVTALLDWHRDNQHDDSPCQRNHNQHSATLKLRNSEEFGRWDAMESKLVPQNEFAEFLDENASDIHEPSPAEMLEVSRDLEVIVGSTFRSKTRLHNGDRVFTYEAETQTRGEVKVPTEFSLNVPLYHGEPPIILNAKFRYRPTANALMMGFVWHRVEYQRQAVFRQIAHAVGENTGLPAHFGRL